MLDKKMKRNPTQKDFLRKDISKMLNLSAFTSWIINTVVVRSTKKLQLISSAITTVTYFVLIIGSITYEGLIERNTIEDYSFLVCSPGDLTVTLKNVRICKENEEPTDVILKIILPIVVTAAILKAVSDLILYKLSNFKNLVRVLKTFRLNTIYYIDVIEKPDDYSIDTLHLLRNNIDLLNRQHPLTGKTIMHVVVRVGMKRNNSELSINEHNATIM